MTTSPSTTSHNVPIRVLPQDGPAAGEIWGAPAGNWGTAPDPAAGPCGLASPGTEPIETEETLMPLYMDVHTIAGGVSADDVAKAHIADLQVQGQHDVRYLRYWVDEERGTVFCLAEAPSAEAAATVHREAHGLVADAIYQVQEGS